MVRQVDIDGAAHLMLPAGGAAPRRDHGGLRGNAGGLGTTAAEPIPARRDHRATAGPAVREFANQYPWQWGPGEIESFTAELVSRSPPLAHATVRGYQVTLRLFCEFVTDARYGWPAECETTFPGSACPDLP